MKIFSLGLSAILGILILGVIIAGFFMWVGAKLAGVENSTFGKSILAAIASSFIMWIITAIMSIIPIIGTIIGFIVGLIFALLAIKGVYSTSTGKALLVWIFNIIAQGVAVVVGILIFVGSLSSVL